MAEHTSVEGIEDAAQCDEVNHPPHYKSNRGVECIDAIRSMMSHVGFIDFLRGQVIKYTWRLGRKPGNQMLTEARKAQWYLNRLVEELQEEQKIVGTSPLNPESGKQPIPTVPIFCPSCNSPSIGVKEEGRVVWCKSKGCGWEYKL